MFSSKSKPEPRGSTGTMPSIIGADLRIAGDLASNGEIHVEGAIEGDIQAQRLTIGEHASVRGSIEADTVKICGAVQGQVHARSVELTRTGRVSGDIVHEVLSIESGAFIDGHCRRSDVKPESQDGVIELIAEQMPNPLMAKIKTAS